MRDWPFPVKSALLSPFEHPSPTPTITIERLRCACSMTSLRQIVTRSSAGAGRRWPRGRCHRPPKRRSITVCRYSSINSGTRCASAWARAPRSAGARSGTGMTCCAKGSRCHRSCTTTAMSVRPLPSWRWKWMLPISTDDFRTLNRCLDDAIAGAVTEYGRERNQSDIDGESARGSERLGFFAHELRNLIDTAIIVVRGSQDGERRRRREHGHRAPSHPHGITISD